VLDLDSLAARGTGVGNNGPTPDGSHVDHVTVSSPEQRKTKNLPAKSYSSKK
jgi:hypothetical protein